MIPYPTMNFSVFWNIYETSNIELDPKQRFLPKQSVLTIYNSSKLYINLEGCVNTLRGECIDFVERYGNDGRDHTGQSKYSCFYHKQDPSYALTRHDPERTYKELLVTIIVPSVLFVVSSISLCVISKTIKVGDDAKMRCICCNEDGDDGFETLGGNNNKKKPTRFDDYVAGDEEENLEQESNVVSGCDFAKILKINFGTLQDMPLSQIKTSTESNKSPVPLSPCEETTEKSFLSSDNGTNKSENTNANEKPLLDL